MAEMNDSEYSADSADLIPGGDFGQGDSNCTTSTNSQTEDFLQQQKLSEELLETYVDSSNENVSSSRQTTSIHDLPSEMLVHIFSFLDIRERIRNELVCRDWRWIGKHTPWTFPTKLVFTRNPVKSSFSIPVTDLNDNIVFSILSRCGSCLKKITLTSKHNDDVVLTCKSIMTISLFCPNLEAIKLHLRLTSDCLETLARGCPNLKVVKIFNLDTNRHDSGIVTIIRKCPYLESLEVSYVCLGDNWFDLVNPKLRKLGLSECTVMPVSMTNLMKRCNALEELQLGFCNYIEVEEAVLFKVLAHFKETLKILKVQCFNVQDDFNWCQGLKGLHSLEQLTLEMCSSVDDRLLEFVVKECPKLRLVAVPGNYITDEGLKNLIGLPWLHTLDISCTKVSGEGLATLAERGVLEEVYAKTADVKESSCCALSRLCPNLRILDVTGSTAITNDLLKEFAAAANKRFFKNVVRIFVGCTSAMKNDITWEGLDVNFTSH